MKHLKIDFRFSQLRSLSKHPKTLNFVIIIDRRLVLCGSLIWSARVLERNIEVIVVFDGVKFVHQAVREFSVHFPLYTPW